MAKTILRCCRQRQRGTACCFVLQQQQLRHQHQGTGGENDSKKTNSSSALMMKAATAATARTTTTKTTYALTAAVTSTRAFSTSSNNQLRGFSLDDPNCNVTPNIASRVEMNLHLKPHHPLNILSLKIQDYFQHQQQAATETDPAADWHVYDSLSPIVSTRQCFDLLNIPADHVSRSPSDTYYLNTETVLRTHTSAHQVDLLQQEQIQQFLVVGDVYRRDEIDRSHYPAFHQMEGVKLFPNLKQATREEQLKFIENDLKTTLEGLAKHLFGPNIEMRWVDEYFPFTHPSFELEILFPNKNNSESGDSEAATSEDDWMEVLGCGVIHPQILKNAGRDPEQEPGWAFGLGLERLAMVLFQIPDIRLFWSQDERFLNQFLPSKDGKQQIVHFQPYSKYPPCYKDVSFWLPSNNFHVNDLMELVREIGGDWIEQVELIDDFVHPKSQRTSHCYRITYRSMDRNLTNAEIDDLQEIVREQITEKLHCELR